MTTPVRQRDRQAILKALRAGVVPGRGLEHLQVGRQGEVHALVSDIKDVKDGGTAVRMIVGRYGSGKSFFLQVIRQAAQRSGCVTMSADVSQDARLFGTGGRVRSLYSSLVASAGTKSQPDGGAMAEVLERFVSATEDKARKSGQNVEDVFRHELLTLRGQRNGHEFADAILAYWRGVEERDEDLREGVMRWLRGEFRTKTEAKAAIGVNGIIGDADLYPSLRLLALLVAKAGYGGLMVALDELAVLARLTANTRNQNYEQILTIINDLLGGRARNLGVVFAGTPEFVTDPVRGLYGYGALRDRLELHEFNRPGLRDTASPVIELEQLTGEDLYILLENVHRVYCSNGQRDPLGEDLESAMRGFLDHARTQLGGLESVSPREATRSWIGFLDILDQNRRETWQTVLGTVAVSVDSADPEPMESTAMNFPAFAASVPQSGGESLDDFTL